MKFPEHFSNDQIIAHCNSLFNPYLTELSVLCKSIYYSIDDNWEDKVYQVNELAGKISSLRGVLKGIELLDRELGDVRNSLL